MGDEEEVGAKQTIARQGLGGPWHVNDSLYCFFYLLEDTV